MGRSTTCSRCRRWRRFRGGTALRNERTSPPPGVGPYLIEKVVAGKSFMLVRNPHWERSKIPAIASGHLDVEVRISADLAANARAVLRNAADVFDPADELPASILGRLRSATSTTYASKVRNATYSILLNPNERPFTSQPAREAVLAGLDRNAIARTAGTLMPGCYLLAPPMVGHPSATCPYGPVRGPGDLALARALVERSGMSGVHVVVQSGAGWPVARWAAYYASLLNRIGFRASRTVITGTPSLAAQTSVASFTPKLPDPALVYGELIARGVEDPNIVAQERVLAAVPAGQLEAVASSWQALDEYTARKAYVAVLGYPTAPILVSSRIDDGAVVFQPVVGTDWSSLRLK